VATNTTNYNLKKPALTDFYNVADQNGNMDLIDVAMKGLEDGKVAKVEGKGLSTNDFTTAEKTKLQNIAANAQVNVIETVKVNGVALTPTSKAVDVIVPAATVVDNTLTSTSTTAALSAAQGKVLKDLADGHIAKGINTENGIHGLRYYNDVLSFYNGTAWIEIETGSGGVAPGNVSGINIAPGSGVLKIKFTDPDDTAWAGTKVVMKAGSYPNNERDGTVILDNTTKNTYSENPFTQSGLTNGTTYYFGFFPYSADGAVNYNVANRGTGTPVAYRTMGITIDLANSNPATSLTYTDDAVGMTPGSTAWDDFFGHYPVMLLNGVENYKLNPNNFAQKVDGVTAADITSGNDGDVMIAFPRRGVTISTSGNIVTIKMTDNPDNAAFEYNAHTRGTTAKDKFYLGAYKGNTISSKLRSLSGKAPTATQTIGTFRTQAQANGAGYENSGFYQLIFRQCMYLLKYKNLNSQVALGRGYVDANSAAIATGGTNAKGMDFGEGTGKLQMKLFGIEDFWGNIWEWIDGLVTDASRNMLTANSSFNDTGSGYTNNGQGATANIGNYMSKPQGGTKTGFIAKEVSGSETTYFCDYASLLASCVACFGGYWSDASGAGAFRLHVTYAASDSYAAVAARLMYL
jgi:hypothetical protein